MRISLRQALAQGAAAFALALAFLLTLAPSAPFTRELGVCESGAVRDVLAGQLILPHFLPGPMVHVPPLYWWTAALGVHALGWSEIALRMPSIAATALTCALLFAWTAVAVNRRAAFWAAASFLLCHFVLDAARQPRMDSMLALFVTGAAIAFERALRPIEVGGAITPGRDFHAQRIEYALAALTMGLGILAKGILGILLPGLAVGLYFVVRGRWRDFFRPAVVLAFFAALAIGLSWYFAAYRVGGQKFLQWQLDMNLWSRFVPAEAGGAGYCAHPFWYFAPHTVAGFIPWSVYLPALALYAWPRSQRRLPEPAVFTLCWFTAIFVFFSLSHGKCLVYILPAFAPLAVLTGITIDAAAAMLPESSAAAPHAGGDASRRPVTIAFNLATIVVAAAAAALVLVAIAALVLSIPAAVSQRLHPTDRRFLEIFAALATDRAPVLPGWIIASMAGSAIALYGVRRRRAQLAAGGVLVIAAAGSLLWFAAMNPALANRETLRDFAREVAQTVPPGANVVHLGLSDCDLNFYSPAPLTPIYRLVCDSGAPDFVVARKRDFMASPVANRSCYAPLLESAPVDNNGTRVLLRRSP